MPACLSVKGFFCFINKHFVCSCCVSGQAGATFLGFQCQQIRCKYLMSREKQRKNPLTYF